MSPRPPAVPLGEEELAALRRVIESGMLSGVWGAEVPALESAMAGLHRVAHAVACSSGTAAIHLALAGLGLEPGDEVITTPISDFGTVAPILACNAVPVFADVDPVTGILDPAAVAAAIGPRTRAIPQALPERLTFENLTRVLSSRGVIRWTLNSAIYSVVSVVIVLLTSSMAGYAFAKKRFPGREVLLWAFLATLMVPFQVMLIPRFVLITRLEGVNTYWGLIVPTLANSQSVFLMRQFIRELPDELFDAAKVDGASEWWVYWKLVLPLTRPILATLGSAWQALAAAEGRC